MDELHALGENAAAARLGEALLKEPEFDPNLLFNLADDELISPAQLLVAAARRLAADPADSSALRAQILAFVRLSNSEAVLAAWRQLAHAMPGSALVGSLADRVRTESLHAAAKDVRRVTIPIALNAKRYIRDIIALNERPGAGWSHMEHWGVWTDGSYARLDLSIPSTDSDLVIALCVHGVPALDAPPVEVRFVVEGCDAGVFRIERRQEQYLVELQVSGCKGDPRTEVGIDLFIVNPTCPRDDDGIVSDSRRLGLALSNIEVRQEKAADSD